MNLKEQQQLRRIRRGDIRSFETLFHAQYDGMYRYALSLLRNEPNAEEVVQDVFYNIWKNRESLRIHRSWQSYLFRSVYNNSMMILRKTRREHAMDEALLMDTPEGNPDPMQELQLAEIRERLALALEGMPARTREIFLMNRQDGLKYREIAEKLSVSVKTVEAHMGKALKVLRGSLEEFRPVNEQDHDET
jgi:RNA polymerase sigma-70 factor (ECF subfamily)